MKPFRWKDETFFNLFKSPEGYKRRVIEPILGNFPQRRFVLVGDSGERDPEIYAGLERKYPEQVMRILIRDVTGEEADGERYQKVFKNVPPERWRVFQRPGEIEAALRGLKPD
jgi:phosphatidate phosphatase APP1